MLTIEKLLFDESSLEILLELDKPGVTINEPFGVKTKSFLSFKNLKGVSKVNLSKEKIYNNFQNDKYYQLIYFLFDNN